MPDSEQTSQQRVLRLLKETGGGLSAKELCKKMKLSSMAVRRQVSLLEGGGQLFSSADRGKKGRPALRYYLTEKGHEAFCRRYATLANELLVALRARIGKEKIEEILRYRKQQHLEQARRRLYGKTLGARVQGVSRFLNEQGYMTAWESVSPGQYLIRLMNCPVEKVARKFPQLCLCEESFLSELLEVPVTRKHHLLRKQHFCSYLVPGKTIPSAS